MSRTLTSETRLGRLALYYMVPEASRYYLSPYLLGVLENVDGAMDGVRMCFHPRNIEPEKYPEATAKVLTLMSLLSFAQRQVLRDVLIYGQKEQLDYLRAQREIPPHPDPDDEPYEITQQDKENERSFWDKQIEWERAQLDPVIECWSSVCD